MTASDVKDLLAKIKDVKRPERTVVVNLRGDLIARITDLESQLARLQREHVGSIMELPEAQALAQQIHDIEEEAEGFELKLVLRAVPGSQWQKALADHPSDDDEDSADLEAVCDAVLADSVVSPEIDAEDLAALFDELSHGQRNTIRSTIVALNGSDNQVPFSRIASIVRRNSDDESKQQDD